MRTKIVISVAVVIALLLLSFLFLRGTGDGLPPGVSVAGINVAGKSEEEAFRFVVARKENPSIVFASKGQKVEGNIKREIVKKKLKRELKVAENSYSFLDRLLGKSVKENIKLHYRFQEEKLRSLLKRLEKAVEEKPRSATVSFTDNLSIKPGRVGMQLEAGAWKKVKKGASRGDSLLLLGRTPWRPRLLTKKDILRDSPAILVVDKSKFQLHLYKKGKWKKSYPIATGKPGFETPSGSFRVANKAIDPAWSVPEWGGELAGQVIPGGTAENPLINRWLGIVDGVGIHGTNDVYSLGSQASHGCIRMDPDQVIELYDQVPVSARVIII